jgi:thiosulfate/3-mercaptopyruvate sulfurtransferase
MGNFKVQPVKALMTLKDDLKTIVREPNPGTAILDARSVEEYLGKEVSGLPRSGHIPTAIHVAWNGFLNKDATVKELSVIKEMLEAKGVGSGQEVICYCTGGVRSAWLYFILKLVGYPKISNYPGSWWEWSRDFACPAEKDLHALQKILGFVQAPKPA